MTRHVSVPSTEVISARRDGRWTTRLRLDGRRRRRRDPALVCQQCQANYCDAARLRIKELWRQQTHINTTERRLDGANSVHWSWGLGVE